MAVVFSLPLLFALAGLAESVIASREWSDPDPSMGGPYPPMSGAIKPYAMLIVLFGPFAFLSWAYLWRASRRDSIKNREQGVQGGSKLVAAVGAASNSRIAPAVQDTIAAESPRQASTLKTAFAGWWAERNHWLANGAKAILLIVYVSCIVMFFTFHNEWRADEWKGEIGQPSPWFVSHHKPKSFYRSELQFDSSSWLVAGVGFLAYYAYWRIKMTETGSTSVYTTPGAHILYWFVLAVLAATFCMISVMAMEKLTPPHWPKSASVGDAAPATTAPAIVPPSLPQWILGPEGPRLSEPTARFWLSPDAVKPVNKALQESYREYLTLEKQEMDQSTNEQGHVITVVHPMTTQRAALEDHLWSRLDAVLNRNTQSLFRLNLELCQDQRKTNSSDPVPIRVLVRPGLSAGEKMELGLQIWREGTWFRWKVRTGAWEDTDTAPELPDEYRRFWKEPSEKKTAAPSRS